mgnify:CR=1 FL=1
MSLPKASDYAAYYADLCCSDLEERVTRLAGRLALGEAKPSTAAGSRRSRLRPAGERTRADSAIGSNGWPRWPRWPQPPSTLRSKR